MHGCSLQMKVKKVLEVGGWLRVLNKEQSHWWVSTMRQFIMRDREMPLWMHKSVYRKQAKDAVYCYICNIHVYPHTQRKWENCTDSTRWSGFPPLVPAGELFNSGKRALLCSTCEEQKQNNDALSLLLYPGKLDRRETLGVCFLLPAQSLGALIGMCRKDTVARLNDLYCHPSPKAIPSVTLLFFLPL